MGMVWTLVPLALSSRSSDWTGMMPKAALREISMPPLPLFIISGLRFRDSASRAQHSSTLSMKNQRSLSQIQSVIFGIPPETLSKVSIPGFVSMYGAMQDTACRPQWRPKNIPNFWKPGARHRKAKATSHRDAYQGFRCQCLLWRSHTLAEYCML